MLTDVLSLVRVAVAGDGTQRLISMPGSVLSAGLGRVPAAGDPRLIC